MGLSPQWVYALRFSAGAAAGHSPADSTSLYFGRHYSLNPSSVTPTNGFDVHATADGIVRRVNLTVTMLSGGTPSTNLSTCALVVNDTPVATISNALTMSSIINTADNSTMAVRVRQGDSLSVLIATPAWSTNPTVVFYKATAFVETCG